MDGNGNIVVGWFDSFQDMIGTCRYDASTRQWGTVRSLAHPVGGSPSLRVAVTANGNAIAVWSTTVSPLGPGNFVALNRYFAGTNNWSGAPVLLGVVNIPTQLNIAADANLNAFVQWEQTSPQGIHSVYQDCFNSETGKWGSADLLSLTNYGEGRFPNGTMDGAGNAVVVWSQVFPTVIEGKPTRFMGIEAKRYNRARGAWKSYGRIEHLPFLSGESYLPQVVTADNTGDALAVWFYTIGSLSEGTVPVPPIFRG